MIDVESTVETEGESMRTYLTIEVGVTRSLNIEVSSLNVVNGCTVYNEGTI